MKLHTVFITYNRLELTKRAIASYEETTSPTHTFCVVDNASSDGTQRWIARNFGNFHLLKENLYPGYAANLGWSLLDEDVTHLHRADNDFIFLPGWCDQVERGFVSSKVGQLGLRTNKEELNAPFNVGGNCVIRRELWDQGLRWDERPWTELGGTTEDYYMSQAVNAMGYQWTRVTKPCIQPISVESADDEYYRQSWTVRGIKF